MEDNFGFTADTDEPEDNSFGFAPEEQDALANYVSNGKGVTELEAGVMGSEQGLTLGHGDELGGVIGAALELPSQYAKGMESLSQSPEDYLETTHGQAKANQIKGLEGLYKEYRDFNRQRYDEAEQTHPGSFTAGSVVGGGLLPMGAFKQIPGIGKLATLAPEAAAANGVVPGLVAEGAVPLASKAVGFGEKVVKGAGLGGVMGAVSGAGNSEAPLMSGEFARDTYEGGKLGTALGASVPAAVGVAKAGYGATKAIASPILKGYRQGVRGVDLLGEEAEKNIQSGIANYGKELTSTIENELNQLGKLKNQLVREAEENGVRIKESDIDEIIQRRLGDDPATNLPEVKREMEQLRELIRTSKDGPLVDKTERVFFGDKPTKLEQFRQQANAKNQTQQLNAVEQQAPDDVARFEADLAKRQREQQMVPGGTDPRPLELEYRTTGEPGQVHGVIKQAQFDADGNSIGYKKVSSKVLNTEAPPGQQPYEMLIEQTGDPNMVLGVIRQPIVDNTGKVTSYKTVSSKLIPREEAAKFKDITTEVRAGGKDLTKPSELLQLYKDLKQKSTYGDYSFKSQEAQKGAAATMKDVQGTLRNSVPGLEETDAKIAALKRGASAIGMEDTTSFDPQKTMETVIRLINQQEKTGSTGGIARQQLKEFVMAIKDHHPGLAQQVEQRITDLGEQAIASKTVTGLTDANMMNTMKRWGVAAGNAGGLGVHKVKQGMQSLSSLPPTKLTEMGQRLIQSAPSKAAADVGKMLIKAAAEPERSRNAILFGLMQNPAYNRYLDQQTPEDMDTDK